jgi:hypothetical protein
VRINNNHGLGHTDLSTVVAFKVMASARPLLVVLVLFFGVYPKQAAASVIVTPMEATYVISAIFFLYLVVDIFLCAMLVAVCRYNNKTIKKCLHRSKSKNKPVTFLGTVKSNDETDNEEQLEISLSHHKSSETTPVNSLTPLMKETAIDAGEVFDAESADQVAPLEQKIIPQNIHEARLHRLQSADYRKDSEAELLSNEIIIEADPPSPPTEPDLETSPPVVDPNVGRLISISSEVTNTFDKHALDQNDSILQKEDKSHLAVAETSFNSTSATSIGYSSVFRTMEEIDMDIMELQSIKMKNKLDTSSTEIPRPTHHHQVSDPVISSMPPLYTHYGSYSQTSTPLHKKT